MTMHPRQVIRQAFVDILTAQVALVAGRVFRSRVYPLQADGELPGICVYATTEDNEQGTVGGSLDRDLSVSVDCYAAGSESPDDDLDALAEQVEAAMLADQTLGGLCNDLYLAGTIIGFDGEGQKANGLARLRYQVRYWTG